MNKFAYLTTALVIHADGDPIVNPKGSRRCLNASAQRIKNIFFRLRPSRDFVG